VGGGQNSKTAEPIDKKLAWDVGDPLGDGSPRGKKHKPIAPLGAWMTDTQTKHVEELDLAHI